MKDILKKIIDISIYAPSGDNCQPWRFVIKGNKILIYNIPEKDESLYNFNMRASLISIGSLIENIKISATHFKYSCEIKLNENPSNDFMAECLFTESLNKEDILFEYIKKRQTNRKPYKKNKVEPNIIKELELSSFFEDINLKIITNPESIKQLAWACSRNEQIVLENKKLHNFLFKHITWTEKEDKIKKGFYIKTLELKKPQSLMFRILSLWKINKILNKLNISKVVAKDNAKLYEQSGLFIGIITNNLDKTSLLKTGMMAQRLWLMATKNNLYMQPLTGITFLNHRINDESNTGEFKKEHVELIKLSYEKIENILDSKNNFITLIFRLGYSNKPSAWTKREDPLIEIEE